MAEAVAQGVEVVASDIAAGLGGGELARGMGHLPGSVVGEPESADGGEGKGQAVGVLGGRGGVGRRAAAAVEDDEENNQQDLVDKLTPTLHEEGHGDAATTVQAILTGGQLAGGDGALERRGGGDGVFTSDTDGVKEEGPGVANDPAVECHAPRGSQHEQTNEHDDGILNETPSTTDPITNNLERK